MISILPSAEPRSPVLSARTVQGKTTIFNLLTKVYQPTRGTFLLDGHDTHNMTTVQISRAGIARTFQNIRLFGDLTVEENVKVAMHNSMSYSMLGGMLRLPKYWHEERVAHERAIELLSIFEMEAWQTSRLQACLTVRSAGSRSSVHLQRIRRFFCSTSPRRA